MERVINKSLGYFSWLNIYLGQYARQTAVGGYLKLSVAAIYFQIL